MSNNCSSFLIQARKDGTDFESRKIIICTEIKQIVIESKKPRALQH